MACRIYKLALLGAIFAFSAPSYQELLASESRIKDLVAIKGNRTNELMGFGLIIGLNGTGDSPASVTTSRAVKNLLSGFGSIVNEDQLLTQSVAAVVVTADLPAFARIGDQIDVKVSIVGDAVSLAGGTLLMSPLKAADGNIYAVAQGPVVVGQASGIGAQTFTVAHVPGGAQVERNFEPVFVNEGKVELSLKQADFTTNTRIVRTINQRFKGFFAKSVNPNSIEVRVPNRFMDNPVEFISELESLSVSPDNKAVVILNERTGTIVMGGDVSISKVVISHDGLSLTIGAEGDAAENNVVPIEGPTVDQLVNSLNAMGVKPKDLVSILQSIHAAGALRAELRYL